MKHVILIFFLAMLSGCAGLGPKIVLIHDDFTGKNQLLLEDILVREKGESLPTCEMAFGVNADKPDSVFFWFSVPVDGMVRLYNCRTTNVLFSGELWKTADPGYELSTEAKNEILYYNEPIEFLRRLAETSTRMQVCGREYEFGPAGLKKISEYYKKISTK